MTLQIATLLTAAILLLLGCPLAWNGKPIKTLYTAALRDKFLAFILFGTGSAWFLYNTLQLGPADFGNFKNLIFGISLAVAISCWFYLPDFLSVRGAAILTLLTAAEFLEAAFGLYEIPQRLAMVIAVYIGIVAALYLGAAPYRLRDFFGWLFAENLRPRILGAIMAAYGIILVLVSFTYPAYT